MKKILLVVAAVSSLGYSYAARVNEEKAQMVAQHFLGSYTSSGNNLELVKTVNIGNTNIPTLYVFNTTAKDGFVIIAADDAVQPVLAYSTENCFLKDGKAESPEVSYWLRGYASQIGSVIISQKTATPDISAKWERLITNNTSGGSGTANKPTAVTPLLATLWDQMPLYNELCPVPGGNYSSTPTGCVATAMAQIMNFWQNPTIGANSHSYNSSTLGGTLSADFSNTTYDWANMPNALDESSSDEQINAIATLMYHCGISVNMDYNTAQQGGSGAMVIKADVGPNGPCSENALKKYFSYKNTIKGYYRGNFSEDNWHEMLKFELDNGRPILYTGFEGLGGGHAFVFDGYDENEMFHVNWGWSGNSNGYFTDANLNPSVLGAGGGSGNFNYMQEALIMIEPENSIIPANPYTPDVNNPGYVYEYQAPDVSATQIQFGAPYTFTGHLKYAGGDPENNAYILPIAVDTNSAQSWNPTIYALNDGVEHIFAPGDTFDYTVHLSNTNMLPNGAYYIVFIYSNNATLQNLAGQQNGDPYAPLLIVGNLPTGVTDIDKNNDIVVYPNPAQNDLNIDLSKWNGSITAYFITDITGKKMLSENLNSNQKNIHINTSSLSAGNYLLNLQTQKGVVAKKITIAK